ncbi:hypothetical protein [Pectobacterium carotovorum]|uniref:hypothetical protein n=1 Tax=Pectobacterium carotovorum TaxID=554 RepID=UPI0015E85D06|nr:hypothetical protein [Pectobacterium carotovorum]
MSEVKFLSDGRKVAVIGQLNNQETIVQEIFVHRKVMKYLVESGLLLRACTMPQ